MKIKTMYDIDQGKAWVEAVSKIRNNVVPDDQVKKTNESIQIF